MSFPASLTVVTVTGTFLDGAGSPRSGKVIFRTPGYTMSSADDTFVVPRVLVAFLDSSGHFSIALPSTNDPDWTPVGWTYTVTLDFGENGRTRFGSIVVPYDLGATLSLAALAPVPEANGQLYALYNDPRFSGVGGGGGGGAVASVFGRTGAVVSQAGDYTKAQVGLGSVDNTSDVAKPVSTLQAAADATVAANASAALSSGLAGKANTTHSHAEADVTSLVSDLALKAPIASPTFTGTVSGVTAAMVGLGNVNNTSDAAKPVSTAQQTALDGKQPLDADLTTIAGLTATTGNVIQSSASAWSSVTPATLKGTLGLVKGDVGLGNVDNTADTAKPVSTAQQTALNLKADLASPTFTGTPSMPTGTTAVTQTAGDSTTKLATTAFTTGAIATSAAGLQPLDSDLTTIAGLTPTTNNVIQSVAGAWASRTPAQVKTALAIANTDVSGLGGAAVLSVGTGAGTVAAGDDSRITGAIQASTFTTKGDLLIVTGASTVTRLAVAADGNVLTADAASSGGVKWAAGGAGSYSLPDGIDPPANDPHAIPNGPVSTNLTTALNRLYLSPMPMGPNTRTLIEVSIEVGAAGSAGAVYRLVLFSSTTGRRPNVSLIDFGTVVGDATGVKKITSLSQSCSANTLYWLGAVEQVASGGALKGISSYNPYVTLHGSDLAGSSAFGAYAMASVSGAVTNGTAFVYFDVDTAPRFGVKFS
jgi:hypothetical protein